MLQCRVSNLNYTQLADPDDPNIITEEVRKLGLCVCRGTSVMMICPVEGTEEIANPFLAAGPEPVI